MGFTKLYSCVFKYFGAQLSKDDLVHASRFCVESQLYCFEIEILAGHIRVYLNTIKTICPIFLVDCIVYERFILIRLFLYKSTLFSIKIS